MLYNLGRFRYHHGIVYVVLFKIIPVRLFKVDSRKEGIYYVNRFNFKGTLE